MSKDNTYSSIEMNEYQQKLREIDKQLAELREEYAKRMAHLIQGWILFIPDPDLNREFKSVLENGFPDNPVKIPCIIHFSHNLFSTKEELKQWSGGSPDRPLYQALRDSKLGFIKLLNEYYSNYIIAPCYDCVVVRLKSNEFGGAQ